MKNENKILLRVTILMIIVIVVCGATYAYFAINQKFYGDFDVEINSKDIDVFETRNVKDAAIIANGSNFGQTNGSSQSDAAILAIELTTSKKSSTRCYQIALDLPDEKVFSYTKPNVPELVVSVSKSNDNENYTPVKEDVDITEATGDLVISEKEIITASNNIKVTEYWKADVTFVWFKDDSQEINDQKEYSATLKATIVDC